VRTAWERFLSERPLAVIATVDPDGTPHAVPVEVVVHGGRVYNWSKRTAVRMRNIERTGHAAILAYKGNAFVLVRGPARLLHEDDALYGPITKMFLEKYDREEAFGNDTLVEITPENVIPRLDT
jgi:uncharacterized pyridoxamine 5'-phosphate oxidase family protein